MSVKFHKLNFVNDEKFFLIALHSNLEIFFLAYLLNKNLKTSFKKIKNDIVSNENKYVFERYQSIDQNKKEKMDLFTNKSILKESQTKNEVFSLFDSSYYKKFFFINEFKDVDFFIKKESVNNLDLLIKKLN